MTSCDGQWWTGVLNGVAGTFPSNYVKPKQTQSSESPQAGPVSPVNSIPLPPPSPQTPMTPMTPKPAIARVVVAYQSTKQGQLTLSNGQLVKVRIYAHTYVYVHMYRGGSISARRIDPLSEGIAALVHPV